MTCAKCGGALEAGKRFCGECGTPVAGVPRAASRRGLFLGIGGVAIGSGLTYLVTRGPSASSPATPTLAPTIPVPTKAPAAPAAPAPTMAPAPASSRRLVVDASGSGDYKTIDGAYFNAKAGETIVVRPGTYRESLTIKSDVRIVGEGGRSKVIVEGAPWADVFSFTAGSATLTGLTIRYTGPTDPRKGVSAIAVLAGTPVIEDCDLTSSAGSAVYFRGAGANPVIRNCMMRNSRDNGVFVLDQGQGTIEKCVIRDNTGAGVSISEGGNPVIRDCEIRDNTLAGVVIVSQGQGTFTGNTLKGNARGAWDIKSTAGKVTRTGNTPNE